MTGRRWLAASTILGRPVTDAEPYPHICGRTLAAEDSLSGRPVYLLRRNCAACAQERHERTHQQPDPAGGAVVDLAAARARRTTRRERPVA
ncbi:MULTISPECIES: hypothetical protein [unclassified Micromonospora]|uniref:hypothetical protein n=1 Tax=unclassified Micromonospora TaxID=2617518 RepID=UPI0003EED79D|nr:MULTISPECIES: hypothetical protein [unclassified Micromonospora]EWM64343.1 hypothetical protein MCBG_01476 [Micromonospora sp. M42]MCK1810213.1 hypothetical protein [Micromonospora sp. R42106]MCK1835530.1 hypothetical protein [Micromonospora sp. R42003]MCK1847461.1 hypothetical protein [Micromonospora sp. R42004]MCM1015310.1 hypothetical protein [Micromonospora sp. XM-20-01]